VGKPGVAGMSDCHCKLSFKILASYQREIINRKLKDFPNRYIWNDKSSEDSYKEFDIKDVVIQ
jgi:hypothetical protein